jgi:hypothetical protein
VCGGRAGNGIDDLRFTIDELRLIVGFEAALAWLISGGKLAVAVGSGS